eukprot:5056388-Prymnesium_polylepis.1
MASKVAMTLAFHSSVMFAVAVVSSSSSESGSGGMACSHTDDESVKGGVGFIGVEGGIVVDFEAPACDGLWAGLRQRL